MYERLLFIRDTSFDREDADPIDAIMVFLTNPHIELDHDVRLGLTGSLVTWVGICSDFFGKVATIVKLDHMKFVIHRSGPYLVAMTGAHVENDKILINQMTNMMNAFYFLHGSFELEKMVAKGDREWFSARLTAVFQSLFPFFRPVQSNLTSLFNAINYYPFTKSNNHVFVAGNALVSEALLESGSVGACICFDDSVVCTSMDAKLTLCIVALLQSESAATHARENRAELLRKSDKIRQLMLSQQPSLVREIEHRRTVYPSAFFAKDMISLLLREGEEPTEEDAFSFASRLLQAGIIHSSDQSSDLRSTESVYFFVKRERLHELSQHEHIYSKGPIIGHHITPRIVKATHPGVSVIRVFLPKESSYESMPSTPARDPASTAHTAHDSPVVDESTIVDEKPADTPDRPSSELNDDDIPVSEDSDSPRNNEGQDGEVLASTLTESNIRDDLKHESIPASQPEANHAQPSNDADNIKNVIIERKAANHIDLLKPQALLSQISETHQGIEQSLSSTSVSTPYLTPRESVIHFQHHPVQGSMSSELSAVHEKTEQEEQETELNHKSETPTPSADQELPSQPSNETDDANDVNVSQNPNATRASIYFDAIDEPRIMVTPTRTPQAVNMREPRAREGINGSSKLSSDRFSKIEITEEDILKAHINKTAGSLLVIAEHDAVITILFESTVPTAEEISRITTAISPKLKSIEQDLLLDRNRKQGRAIDVVRNADNHVVYRTSDDSINGWCNTHWSEPRSRFQPDTNQDRAFVNTIQCMHEAFSTKPQGEVIQELLLRRIPSSLVYGRRAFDTEVFVQPRQLDAATVDAITPQFPVHAREQLAKKIHLPYL